LLADTFLGRYRLDCDLSFLSAQNWQRNPQKPTATGFIGK